MIQKHLKYLMEIKPEKVAVSELRAHAAWYLKGIPSKMGLVLDVKPKKLEEVI
jgi:tRNA-dihydrouridine synthase